MKTIDISSGNTSAVVIPERGGIVTELVFNGHSMFYLDEETVNDLEKNVRGGIPILFPNAGPLGDQGRFPLLQHGFGRRLGWEIREIRESGVILNLVGNDETRVVYPFDFGLILSVSVEEGVLRHSMEIENRGDVGMPVAYGIHPYFFVPKGMKNQLITNIDGFDPRVIDWGVEFDKPFKNNGKAVFHYPGGKEISIISGLDKFKYLRIWSLPDKDFICIEPWWGDDFALNSDETSFVIAPKSKEMFEVDFVIREL